MADPFVTPQAAEILRAARERIATPERWTQGAFSNTGTGSANPGAWRPDTCLCVNGALLAVAWAMPAETTGTLLRSGASLCLSLAARARGFETASRPLRRGCRAGREPRGAAVVTPAETMAAAWRAKRDAATATERARVARAEAEVLRLRAALEDALERLLDIRP